jgi:hypothetical protein
MRLLLICSSLENGKDGVGDYTTRLGAELARLGHEPLVLGWVDPHARQTSDAVPTTGSRAIRCVRLPKRLGWAERERLLSELMKRFRPEAISLQYVPWSYGRYGASGAPARTLRRVIPAGVPCQLMLHEPWIGARSVDSCKERLIGYFQKKSILHLARSLNLSPCHCSNPYYLQLFRGAGIEATLLPLFGNIPIADKGAIPEVEARIQKQTGVDLAGSKRREYLHSAVFGTVHPQWDPSPAVESCLRHLDNEQKGQRLAIMLAGRNGKHADRFLRRLQARFGDAIVVAQIGELTPFEVSALFHQLDFGWAANPYALVGKSGSAIAMLEHGLPLLATRNDMPPAPEPDAAHFIARRARLFSAEGFDWAAFLDERRPPESVLRPVAEQFLSDLKNIRPCKQR